MKWHFCHFQGVTVWLVFPLCLRWEIKCHNLFYFLFFYLCNAVPLCVGHLCMCGASLSVSTLITHLTAHPVVAEISQSCAAGAGKPGTRRRDAYRKILNWLRIFPCRREVQIGMCTMLEPPGYNFSLKRRVCCVQLWFSGQWKCCSRWWMYPMHRSKNKY